jgi:hypothetical protein
MNTGRNLIIGFDQVGKHYDFIIDVSTNSGMGVANYYFLLFEGVDSWKNSTIHGEGMFLLDVVVDSTGNPEDEIQRRGVIATINTFLKNKFAGTGAPMTWIEKLEAVLSRIVFFRDAAGVPQIKIQ